MKYSIKDKTPSQNQFICCMKKGCNYEITGWFHGVFNGAGQITDGLGNMHEFDSWTDETEIKPKKPISSYNPLQHRLKRKIVKCKTHGEYNAYVADDRLSDCPDCIQEEIRNERRIRSEELKKNLMKAKAVSIMNKSAVPPLFRDITFDDFVITCKDAEKVITILKQYVDAKERVFQGGKSILLHGEYRTGKSMLGVSIINEMMKAGYTAMYIKSYDLVEYVKRTWSPSSAISQDEQIDKFVKFDFLCVDNFPWGVNTEKERQVFTAVIDRRVENLRPTITTTRMSPKEIEKKYHTELSERLTFRGAAIHFSWEKYKTQGLF